MDTAYTFDDVMFVPQYSDIQSRSEVKLDSKIGNINLSLPLISANMADITEEKMILSMNQQGGMGIMHRFMTVEENVEMFINCAVDVPIQKIGVSIGIGEGGQERFKALHGVGARTFCIDVAHGHHINVRKMLEWINNSFDKSELTVIAGNVASAEGALDLLTWGANVVKAGVGPGSACQTRENTGVGVPQLYVLEQIRKYMPQNTYLIADGGIKKTGDIAKALKYADAVMMGGFFAGSTETPGHVFETMNGDFYKTMAGSASAEGKTKNGKDKTFVEGGIRQVPFRGHVKYLLDKAKENVQSSFSYSGARNIDEFRKKSVLVKISGGGKKESKL